MKRAGAIFLIVFGVLLVLFGLLFIMGSAGRVYRFVIAAVSLALGGVLAGMGIRFFKQADMLLPEQLRAEIMQLAKERNGEVSEADIRAALGRRFPHADKVLGEMRVMNLCRLQKREGEIYYVFPDIMPRLTIRRCQYCGAELPLDEQLDACPNCGGSIKTNVEKLSLSKEEFYNMDE